MLTTPKTLGWLLHFLQEFSIYAYNSSSWLTSPLLQSPNKFWETISITSALIKTILFFRHIFFVLSKNFPRQAFSRILDRATKRALLGLMMRFRLRFSNSFQFQTHRTNGTGRFIYMDGWIFIVNLSHIGSMYGIFTYIWLTFMVNVGI